MTPEEKHVIEELLAGCSPTTVQRIVNTGNNSSILLEEKSDEFEENSGIEEVTNFVFQDMDYHVSKGINQPKPVAFSLPQQLSPSSTNIVQDYEISCSQEILTPFDVYPNIPTPFDIQEDLGSEDSQYAFSPLKLIAKKLLMLHCDVYPNEMCPTINRSPSLIGLMQRSPKLDIPHLHFGGRMIQHHPLIRYKKADQQHPLYDEVEASSEEQQPEGSTTVMLANDLENMQIPKKAPKKPSRFKKFTSYLERKLHFSRKKEVLPQIGCKPAIMVN